jgi:hypothetical protein
MYIAGIKAVIGRTCQCFVTMVLPNKASTMTTVTRLRHKPQTEDEDASALKLGPGVLTPQQRIHCVTLPLAF